MINAELITKKVFNTVARTILYRYDFSNVLGLTQSDEIKFSELESSKGKLAGFKISNLSDNFDVSLRCKQGLITPKTDEVLNVIEIVNNYQEMNLGTLFSNNDESEDTCLYFRLLNNSAIDTGINTVELLIERM